MAGAAETVAALPNIEKPADAHPFAHHCAIEQLIAIFVWLTLEQAETYLRAAKQEKLAGDAMGLLARR